MMQVPFAPAAGFVQAVLVERYPTFPGSLLKRILWVRAAPVEHPPTKDKPDPQRFESDKHVLLLLATYCNDAGRAWPAVSTIVAETNMSRATAQRALGRLAKLGWLTKRERVRASTMYWPKSPADEHCRGCWMLLPRGQALCPSCGRENRPIQLFKGLTMRP